MAPQRLDHSVTINGIRGFRRIGWPLTFPLAALIVLAFYESTKEFSPAGYDVQLESPQPEDQQHVWVEIKKRPGVVALKWGYAHFLPEVPKHVVEQILNDFDLKVSKVPSLDRVYVDDHGDAMPLHWTFTVYRAVNKFKLAGLIAGSLAFSILVIQGAISALAWIAGGADP
jgi:hypothetical protein